MNIKEKRFSQKKDGSWSDNFMLTYLQLKLASETKISVFNRKLKEREIRQMMEDLCVTGSPFDPEEVRAEWKDMTERYIHICYDPETRMKLYGIIKRKNEAVAWQLLKEIERTTKTYPGLLGREEEFTPLYDVMMEVWNEILGDVGKGSGQPVLSPYDPSPYGPTS